jgi:hypothetical protein
MTDDQNPLKPEIHQYETFVNEVLKSKLKYLKAKIGKNV